eukprot:CAMPEP_0178521146 /NCGR_PEP_ID=MMETSP0696-20121128/27789_1 /TAXON_ID=265572 /ORGANISM="Extubocellulus spinifer, Strain CCMP396" /LENGTH=1887 /DNA_ID=CAMNT_0020152065 /DNA_START=64 /DNA_END=5728 /DNA_ORIENTATION=+
MAMVPGGGKRPTRRKRNGLHSSRNAIAIALVFFVVVCYDHYVALRASFSSPRSLGLDRPGLDEPRDLRTQTAAAAAAAVAVAAEPDVKWPSKLGFCTTGGWPSEVILTAEDAPIQLFVYEMEKVENEEKLSILVAAVSDEEDIGIATTLLLSKVQTSLRCDFLLGDVSQNAKREPIHRSPVDISVLAEDKKKRGVVARITCALPLAAVLKEKHTSLPEAVDIAAMDKHRRAREESREWMHWQLSLPGLQSQTESITRSWIAAPSFQSAMSPEPYPPTETKPPLDRRPSADDYGPRGESTREESSNPVKVGLCITPPAFSKSTNEKWMNSSIDEWIHYQRNIVGFSDIFYLDPFGEDLVVRHPELSPSLRSGMQHVPHMPVRTSMNGALSGGSVASSLALERCSTLARQRHIQYILPMTDPMDLVLPLQRKMHFLPVALGSVVGKDCIESVQASSVAWSLGDPDGAQRCEEAWCNLPDAVDSISSFLFSGKILFLDEASSSEFRFYNVSPVNEPSLKNSCRKMTMHNNDLFHVLRNSPVKTRTNQVPPQHRSTIESISQIVQSIAVWVRHDIRMAKKVKERVRKKRNMLSDSSWIPISPTESGNLRSCRAFGDKGPQYGEAIVSRRTLSSGASRDSHLALRLSFYNAETVISPITGLRVLSLSLYAESYESIKYSLGRGWAALYQSESLHELLPNMATCVYSQPDLVELPRKLQTKGQLRILRLPGDVSPILTWLECPLPEELPLPGPRNLVSQVTIATIGPSNAIDFHMTRPVHLCFGAEPMGKQCDEISVACKVGCVDDLKPDTHPQAQCCSRCHEDHHSYQRFDERDTSTPEVAAISVRERLPDLNSGARHPRELPNTGSTISKPRGDLSVCLRPFYTESMSREKDAIDPPTPQRMVEWLEYHLLVGFDIVYILDRYGTALLPLLEPYVSSGRVIHVPFPFQSDAPFSSEARSGQTRLVPSAHDQVMAYDLCLSIARQRNDYFTAFIDLDEFIRYPRAEAGRLRRSIRELLTNQTEVPDQIYLERFDVETEATGFALRYTNRFVKPRYDRKRKKAHGKVLTNPQGLVYGGVMVHFAIRSGYGAVTSVANSDALSISHYRPYNYEKKLGDMQEGAKGDDNSLQWAHDILSTQFIASAGWKGMEALSRQGLLRLEGVRAVRASSRRDSTHAQSLVSDPDTCHLLFIGILSYCSDRDRRDSIRQTWLSAEVLKAAEAILEVKWKFILGQQPTSEQSQFCQGAALAAEAEEFGDLLFLPDLPESYQVLTRKTLAMFGWANVNVDADFVLKTDDDSYVNILAFASDLQQVESSDRPLYWGNHQKLSPWLTSTFDLAPKWYTLPEDYPEDVQTYATGAGYLLSRPLVRHLAMVSQQNDTINVPWGPEDRMGWLEDASVGYLLRGAVGRAGRVKREVADTWFWNAQCNSVYFVVHHLNASQQLELHPLLFPVRGLTGASCEQLESFGKEMPAVKEGARATSTRWGGSILDRPVSPSIAAPPPFDSRHLPLGNGRDVLVVTGGTHNIGRYLVDKLQQGYSHVSPLTILVLGAAKRDTINTDANFSDRLMGIQTVMRQVDITDYELLIEELTAYQGRVRGIVHLAAVSRVQDCHSNVTRCKEVNVEGTKNILKALWTMYGKAAATSDSSVLPGRTPLPWLVFASSREVYGSLSRDDVATETSPLRPFNIYGETKLQAENAIQQWAVKTGFNAVVVRFTNVYGSCNDHQSRLVPNLIMKLSSNRRFDIFGSADKTISLLHVDDAVQALILSIRYAGMLPNGAGYFEPFNIGGGPDHDALNMKDIVRTAQSSVALSILTKCKFCHQSAESRVLLPSKSAMDRSPEPDHFRASIDKAFRVLGYQPSRTFDAASISQYLKTCVFLPSFRSTGSSTRQS